MTQLKIGDRVMWRYGTKDYANYGEIGTVTATGPMYVTVTMDDSQPFHRAMFGAKSKREGHARVVDEFRHDEVVLLADAYRDTAARLRRVADGWEQDAEATDAYQNGTWCGECAYGVVQDPPCCTQPDDASIHIEPEGAE